MIAFILHHIIVQIVDTKERRWEKMEPKQLATDLSEKVVLAVQRLLPPTGPPGLVR
jgi:hypothetical protein